MKKLWALLAVGLTLSMAGCHPTEGLEEKKQEIMNNQTDAYTYHLENGDLIQLELSSDYTIDATDPFVISQEGETVAIGIFMPNDLFEDYKSMAANEEEGLSLIEEGMSGENEYIFYSVSEGDEIVEWDFMTKIADSSTVVVVGSDYSEDRAEKVYHDITFTFGGVEEVEETEEIEDVEETIFMEEATESFEITDGEETEAESE